MVWICNIDYCNFSLVVWWIYWPCTQANSSVTWPEQKASFLEDWLKSLCTTFNNSEHQPLPTEVLNDEDGFSPNVTQKSMLSSALQSLLGIYTGRNQQVITQRFEQLARSICMNDEQWTVAMWCPPSINKQQDIGLSTPWMDNPSVSGILKFYQVPWTPTKLPGGSCFGSWRSRLGTSLSCTSSLKLFLCWSVQYRTWIVFFCRVVP